jgi:hypothetical protein
MRKAVKKLDVIHERATWFQYHLQLTFRTVMSYIASASLKKADSVRIYIETIKNSGARDENEKITIKVNGRLAHTVKYLTLLLQYYESLCDHGYVYGQVTQPPDLDEKKTHEDARGRPRPKHQGDYRRSLRARVFRRRRRYHRSCPEKEIQKIRVISYFFLRGGCPAVSFGRCTRPRFSSAQLG